MAVLVLTTCHARRGKTPLVAFARHERNSKMKKINISMMVLLLIMSVFVNAQQDFALRIQQVPSFATDDPPNFVIDPPSGLVIVRWLYNELTGNLYGITNYFYITNTGGSGSIDFSLMARGSAEFTENKKFTVEGLSSYTLETFVPVRENGTTTIFTGFPGVEFLSRQINGVTVTGAPVSTLMRKRSKFYFENITFANNMFVVVGNYGAVNISSDGKNWAKQNFVSDKSLSSVAYGNGLWVVTAWDSFIYTSENAEIWKQEIVLNDWLSGVIYGNGRFVAVGGSIYTSVDGSKWDKAIEGSYNFSGLNYVNNTFIAVGDGIFTSTTGTSWTQVLPPPSDSHISGIAYGNGVYVAVGWKWGDSKGIVYTSLNGSEWVYQTMNIADIKMLDKVAFGNGHFIAVGDSGAVIESTDGIAWTLIPSGTTKQLTGITFGDSLFVAVGEGYTILTLSTTTDIFSKSTNLPESFLLYQNYPNPFNPNTTIDFHLPQRAFVSLKVFDLIGSEIATIISEELLAGSYSKQWNANNLSSGIYFYRLQADNYTETKKLLLSK